MAQQIVSAPKLAAQPISTGLRPNRSARGPATSAPSINPASPKLKTGPSAARLAPHSCSSAGAT